MDPYNSHRRLEMLAKSLYDLDRDSNNYWSMFFSIAMSLFNRSHELGLEPKDYSFDLQVKINKFLLNFKSTFHGKTIIPTLFEIESKIDNMKDSYDVIIIRDRSYSFGVRTREISRYEIIYNLSNIRDWVFSKVNSINIKYSVPNLNVEL